MADEIEQVGEHKRLYASKTAKPQKHSKSLIGSQYWQSGGIIHDSIIKSQHSQWSSQVNTFFCLFLCSLEMCSIGGTNDTVPYKLALTCRSFGVCGVNGKMGDMGVISGLVVPPSMTSSIYVLITFDIDITLSYSW